VGGRDEFEVQGSSSVKEQGAEPPTTWFALVPVAGGIGNVGLNVKNVEAVLALRESDASEVCWKIGLSVGR